MAGNRCARTDLKHTGTGEGVATVQGQGKYIVRLARISWEDRVESKELQSKKRSRHHSGAMPTQKWKASGNRTLCFFPKCSALNASQAGADTSCEHGGGDLHAAFPKIFSFSGLKHFQKQTVVGI